MVTLASRQYKKPEDFVEDFLATLAGAPRKDLTDWTAIKHRLAVFEPLLKFYSALKDQTSRKEDPVAELADSLLASDEPLPLLRCGLEILGHTGTEIVTRRDDLNIAEIAGMIANGDRSAALNYAGLVIDLGIWNALSRKNLEDLFLGVQIGLESHRRKNVGGRHFSQEVEKRLIECMGEMRSRTHFEIQLLHEQTIPYGSGLTKKVDFLWEISKKRKFAFELNFYTTQGSKPTEIKRTYNDIRRALEASGVELIWITDGKGYRGMKRSLRDAYIIHPNIYNLRQAQEHLVNDVITALESSEI